MKFLVRIFSLKRKISPAQQTHEIFWKLQEAGHLHLANFGTMKPNYFKVETLVVSQETF